MREALAPGGDSLVDYKDPTWLAEERQWCERAKRGDQRAFAQIYRAFAKPLYGSLVAKTKNPAVAEECRLRKSKLCPWTT
ncbi:MAG: hypothetical protein IT381_04470 [Deltaproteobacteria bacterium]|nr:hypothetical protein [Deltaproteobacteria bacterium]